MIILLIGILVLFWFLAYRTRKRKRIPNFFLGLSVPLLLLLLAEFAYRNFFTGPKLISTVNRFYDLDSLTGFKWKDTGRVKAIEYLEGGDTIYNTYYSFLSDTIAGTNYPFRKGYKDSTSNREAVFLGCSYTFGECLADEETLPYQFGQLTGISSVNRACNGYGIHQIYQLFQSKYAKADNHNRIFIYSFLRDHFLRANQIYKWNIAGPYFVMSGDTLLNKGPIYKFKKVKGLLLAHYLSLRGTLTIIKDNTERIISNRTVRHLDDDDLAPCYRMLQLMAKNIQESGGRLIILNWDNDYKKLKSSKALNQDTINARLEREVSPFNALVLPVSKAIDFADPANFVPKDGHPSALADKRIAEYLVKNMNFPIR